ncbi:MAG TPA: FkbM family methyltransferase [Candidatus Angelobacter sp.]|nr:FkbM family methyltransferase [Candidatus Angelobacter sp.]
MADAYLALVPVAWRRPINMQIKSVLNPFFSLAARGCESSSAVAHLIRRVEFRGKGSIIQRIRPEAMRREVTADCDGILYRLDLEDDVQRELYFNRYEREDIRQVLSLIPRGGSCLDVGANNGAFALRMAQKVGPKGIVHAFEPDGYVFSRLLHNSRLNGFETQLHCHNLAITNSPGPIVFYRSERSHSGWGSLIKFGGIAIQADSVDGTTLDHFLGTQRIRSVDLIKIDVEAHEPELLEGARESLLNQVFRFVLIEYNGIRLAERGKTLEDFLHPFLVAGYRPYKMRLAMLQKMRDREIQPNTVCANFLFAADGDVHAGR